MARKRLIPTAPRDFSAAAPEAKSLARLSGAPPIAHVASDAAARAALEDITRDIARARAEGRMVAALELGQVDDGHMARDRMTMDPGDLAALKASIAANGQRTPIEVTEREDGRFGLISGLRRLTALRELQAETADARYAHIAALIRSPATAADAYVAMVEENEIRADLSHYERARIVALSVAEGVFADEREALRRLFATASRAKRSKIGSFLELYHALDGVLAYPAQLPERLGLKMVEAVRRGETAMLASALRRARPDSPDAEQDAIARALAPLPSKHLPDPLRDGSVELLPGVFMTEKRGRKTLTLKLSGQGMDDAARDRIIAALRGIVPR